jgi:hypothetical protein
VAREDAQAGNRLRETIASTPTIYELMPWDGWLLDALAEIVDQRCLRVACKKKRGLARPRHARR